MSGSGLRGSATGGEPGSSYAPLNPHKEEIRILRLKPRQYNRAEDKEDPPIVCLLENRSLSDVVVYTALSYAWESGLNPQPVLLSNHERLVSGNLVDALRHLRHESEDVMLWVDQLCINQDDYAEKASQIQMMRNIYGRAVRVVSCLGVSADDSDLVLIALRHIARYHISPLTTAIPEEIIQELQRTDSTSHIRWRKRMLLEKLMAALSAFTDRTSWRRLWTLQEFVVAENLVIMCGTQTITDDCFHNAWKYMNGNYKGYSGSGAYIASIAKNWRREPNSWNAWLLINRFISQRAIYHSPGQPETDHNSAGDLFRIIYTTLTTFSGHHPMYCADPRDRIFSLLGLASDSREFCQFPDYNRSTEGVYEELARALVQQGHVDVLSFCQENPVSRRRQMVSWAADWSLKIRIPLWGKLPCDVSAGWSIDLKCSIPDDKSLTLSGTCVGVIQSHGSRWIHDDPLTPTQAQTFLRELRHFCSQSESIPVDEEEFVCAQIAVPSALPFYYGNKRAMLMQYRAFCERLERPSADSPRSGLSSEESPAYEEQLLSQLFRCPFVMDSGFLGIAPPYIQEGDIVSIFTGSCIPYILRQVSDNKFMVVGGAYIYGIMHGEYFAKHRVAKSFTLV